MTRSGFTRARFASLLWRGHWNDGVELAERSASISAGLQRRGVAAGDKVAIVMRNSLEMLLVQRAVSDIGAYAVPVNWHGSAEEQAYVVHDSLARILIVHTSLWQPALSGGRVEQTVIVDDGSPDPVNLEPFRIVRWDDLPASGALVVEPGQPTESIIYTSGTTGRPKGVRRFVATPEQAEWSFAARSRLYGMRSGARVMVTAPLYHAAPAQLASFALLNAEAIVLKDRFDPVDLLATVAELRITHLFAVPTMFSRILNVDLSVRESFDVSSLEFVLHAGAPCPPVLKRRMIEEWGPVLFEYYGSTELGPVTFCDSKEWMRFPGTVGRPLAGIDLVCLDETSGLPQSTAPGEIAVHNAAAADFTYVGDDGQRSELQRGTYVATGDVGYLNEEGYLFISDRINDVIISGGVNIYPAEIEGIILELSGVADCAVFAVPDEDLGETVAAIIQLVEGHEMSDAGVRAFVASRLGKLKVPRLVEFREALPREETGKIKKRLLRADYWPIPK
jgi:long-chain acyl-CoA synthetase